LGQSDPQNPVFNDFITTNFEFEKRQKMKFEIWDDYDSAGFEVPELLGWIFFYLGEIVKAGPEPDFE
jgi:hypothetical protein